MYTDPLAPMLQLERMTITILKLHDPNLPYNPRYD